MNLLIVDDTPISLKLLRAQLEAEGHTVFEAHDGVDALALLERQRVDAVISDILMPRMDGYRLCQEIRRHARLRDLPIIMYTSSFTSPGDAKLALDVGADKYLTRPASVETIITALHEAIAILPAARQPKALPEVEVLKEYSERLVSKLKEKNTELLAQTEALRLPNAAITAAANAILIANRDGTIVWVNPAYTALTGYTLAEAVGKNSRDLVKSGQQERAVYEEMWATILAGRVWHGQFVNRRKGGSLYPEEQTITPVRDAHGEITHFITIKQDLSERQQAEEALRESEKHYRSLFDNMLNGYAYCRMIFADGRPQDFTYLEINRAFEALTGLKDVMGKNVSAVIPGIREADAQWLKTYGRVALTGVPERFERYIEALDMWFSISVYSPKKEHFVAVFDVITERKRAEEALRGYASRLRELSHRLRTVEETERHAISRELHDRIGQELSTLALILGSLGAKLSQESLRAVAKPLQDMRGLLKSMVANVRDVMAELRPPVLDDYGLLAALRQLVTEFANRTGIAAELSGIELQPRLPSIIETAMFRISQEALNNIAKHAQAKNVELSLYAVPDRVVLDIADDGIGFDTNATPPDKQHWGLSTMRERAEAVGIAFRLESAPGTGTRIVLEAERAAT